MKLYSSNLVQKSTTTPEPAEFKMSKPFWNVLTDLVASQKKLSAKSAQLAAHVKLGYLQAEDLAELRSIQDNLKTYGATESLMACVNEGNQLARCLAIAIPEVNAVNAQSVGIACCEAIDEKLQSCCGLTCKFMKDLADNVTSFINAFTNNVECQKETLKVVSNAIISSVKFIDAVKFAKADICGYAQPVFMERINAISELIDGIKAVESEEDVKKFIPALQKLGYVVEQNIEVRPETEKEAKATEPAPEDVMSAPVKEAEKSEEDLGEVQGVPEAIPQAKEATDACQEQEVAVLRWTPTLISNACDAVIEVLGKADGLVAIGDKIKAIVEQTAGECAKEGDKTPEVRAAIDSNRRFASFLSSVLHLLGSATNELVDQVVGMSAVLKKYEAKKEESETAVVAASDVTPEKPLADACSKAGFRFSKKLVDENLKPEVTGTDPSMTVKDQPKPAEGAQPAAAPAESGDSQKEVKQTVPPDASMPVPEQPKPEAGTGAAKSVPQPNGEKVQPEVKLENAATAKELSEEEKKKYGEFVKEKLKSGPVKTVTGIFQKENQTKAEGGLVEDPIIAPVAPAPINTPEVVPTPTEPAPATPEPAPAEPIPVAPTAPEAPAAPVTPAVDPVVAPSPAPVPPATENNANSGERPDGVPSEAKPIPTPKGAEEVKTDPKLEKTVTDPVPETVAQPEGKQTPAVKEPAIQKPENIDADKNVGKLWF